VAAETIIKTISNYFVTAMASSLKQIYFVLYDMESIGVYTLELARQCWLGLLEKVLFTPHWFNVEHFDSFVCGHLPIIYLGHLWLKVAYVGNCCWYSLHKMYIRMERMEMTHVVIYFSLVFV